MRARPRDLSDVVMEMPINPRTVGHPAGLGKDLILPVQLVAVAVERESRGKPTLEYGGDDPDLRVRGPRNVLKRQATCSPLDHVERGSDLGRAGSGQNFLHGWNGDAGNDAQE